jgi:hypothetical protein
MACITFHDFFLLTFHDIYPHRCWISIFSYIIDWNHSGSQMEKLPVEDGSWWHLTWVRVGARRASPGWCDLRIDHIQASAFCSVVSNCMTFEWENVNDNNHNQRQERISRRRRKQPIKSCDWWRWRLTFPAKSSSSNNSSYTPPTIDNTCLAPFSRLIT